MTGLDRKQDDTKKETVVMGYFLGSTELDADQTIAYKNYTLHTQNYIKHYYIFLSRDVSLADVDKQTLNVMPGFRFTWWYTGAEVTPEYKYKDEEMTKQFVR